MAMEKIISKLKKNNKGMSLIEVLVTIAVVALVAVPLVNSFINTIKTNAQASLIQNGTAVAQDTAELFKVFSVESMAASYEGVDGVTVDVDETTGKYTFDGIPMQGADGEDFLVTVELDPTAYTKGSAEDKIVVNDVNLPVFSGLYGSDCIMLYRQYASFDEQLADLFADKLDADTLANINTAAVRSKMTKSSDINVACVYSEAEEQYHYTISIEMTYVYNSGESVVVVKNIEKTYKGDEIHSVYLICPIFDLYTTTGVVRDKYYYNTDKINLNYTYEGTPEKKHELYFYIAEQQMYNVGTDSTKLERINPANVTINGVAYTSYDTTSTDNMLKLYTNVGDEDITNPTQYGLTYGDYNTGTALYQMNVTVKQEGSNDVVAVFTTTR